MGNIFIPPVDSPETPYGMAMLLVDNDIVAESFFNQNRTGPYGYGYYPLSVNTIQQLEPGQVVEAVWFGSDGAFLWSDSAKLTHFTGQLLGNPRGNDIRVVCS